MGCSKCKEKKTVREEVYNSVGKTKFKVVLFFIIWSILGIYGLVSLINLLLK